MKRWAPVILLSVMLGAGCGGSDPGISRAAGNQLVMRVAAVRAAAGHADRITTTRRLSELLTSVDRLALDGEIDHSTATRIRHAAAAVRVQIGLLPVPTTTTTTTTRPDEEHGNGKSEKGKSGEHGHGKD